MKKNLRYFTILVFVASVFIQSSLEAGPGTISTYGFPRSVNRIVVNSTLDELNEGDGNCTLREAIINVNDGAQTYLDCSDPSTSRFRPTIYLPEGNYCLSLQPPVVTWDGERADDDDNNVYGDLDIKASVIIRGASSSTTIVDGGNASDSSSRGCTTVMGLSAFAVHSGSVTFRNLKITGGGSDAWTGQEGGGIYATFSVTSLTLDNVVMTENHNQVGSVLYSTADSTSILDSDISGNSGSLYGGAIYVNGDSLEIENSTVSHNSTTYGLMTGGLTTVTIQTSTFSNNGYGIRLSDSADIINSTISSNSNHGLSILGNNDVNIYSSTIAQNGTGVSVDEGHVNFVLTIIANNDTADCDLSGSFTDTTTEGSYNLITDLSSCGNSSDFTNTVEDDPLLSDLTDNGGDTETMALQSGSPAIDSGYCDSAVVGITDQRGYDRTVDGDSDGTETCDIGAYERQGWLRRIIPATRVLH